MKRKAGSMLTVLSIGLAVVGYFVQGAQDEKRIQDKVDEYLDAHLDELIAKRQAQTEDNGDGNANGGM